MLNDTLTPVDAVEIPAANEGRKKTAKKPPAKLKGIFEKVPGSDVWWARYADASGRIRREKAGTKGMAVKLYQKRKTEAMQGRSSRKPFDSVM